MRSSSYYEFVPKHVNEIGG